MRLKKRLNWQIAYIMSRNSLYAFQRSEQKADNRRPVH